jgi:hypothetical protein
LRARSPVDDQEGVGRRDRVLCRKTTKKLLPYPMSMIPALVSMLSSPSVQGIALLLRRLYDDMILDSPKKICNSCNDGDKSLVGIIDLLPFLHYCWPLGRLGVERPCSSKAGCWIRIFVPMIPHFVLYLYPISVFPLLQLHFCMYGVLTERILVSATIVSSVSY